MKATRVCNRNFLFLVIGIPIVLINGVPEARALQKAFPRRFPRLYNDGSTTTLNQSSRPLFSPLQPSNQSQYEELSKVQQESQQSQANKIDVQQTENKLLTSSTAADNIKFLMNSFSSSLSRHPKVWTTTTTSLISMLTVYAMLKTGNLTGVFKHTSWWIQNMFYSYQNSLVQNPLSTKVATGAILAIVGDALAQYTTGSKDSSYDKRRALSFAVFDSFYRVFQHNMFPAVIAICQGSILRKIFPWIVPSVSAAIERTMMYQLVVVPCIYYPVFFAFTGFIQGLSVKGTLDRAKSQFFLCWRRNLMFWIPTQFILFGAIDEKWQIPFACVMGMLWSTILSLTAGKTNKNINTNATTKSSFKS